jgi:hypothetical protein
VPQDDITRGGRGVITLIDAERVREMFLEEESK